MTIQYAQKQSILGYKNGLKLTKIVHIAQMSTDEIRILSGVSMNIDVKTANILAIGSGCKVSSALKRLIELCRYEEESLQAMKNMSDALGMSIEEYANKLIYFNDGTAFPTYELLEKMSDLLNQESHSQPDISSLKKRIKYCKNPMEKKKLQQELNALYKE